MARLIRHAGGPARLRKRTGAMTGGHEMDPKWRTLVVAAVALAYPLAEAGFQLGAYGQMLFNARLASWLTITVTLLVLVMIPRQHLPVPRSRLWLLAIPSLWLLARLVIGALRGGEMVHPLLFALGFASYALCVPFEIYLMVRIVNPDLVDLRGARVKLLLIVMSIGYFSAGYGIGARNDLFLTCEEFRTAGMIAPANCRSVGTEAQESYG